MLTNAVIVSVIVMVALSLMRVNVLFAITIAALTAGLVSGLNFSDSVNLMVSGMGAKQIQPLVIYCLECSPS